MGKKDLTERQKKALELKGDHRILMIRNSAFDYMLEEFGFNSDDAMFFIVDLDELGMTDEEIKKSCKENPDKITVPDWTPEWLYRVIGCFGNDNVYEEMESLFGFSDDNTIQEFKEICDLVIDEV